MVESQRETTTYGVIIATCNRHDILPLCVEHVLRQNCLPSELIIIDATPEWADMRERLDRLIRAAAPDISFQYQPARERSSSTQRNQGIALATADVLFLIDDDSLMFADCAQEILAVYAADRCREVAGVQAALADAPPVHDGRLPERKVVGSRVFATGSGFRRWVNRYIFMMASDQLFLPYWGRSKHALRYAKFAGVTPVALFHGCRMTFRREVIAQVLFEESFQGYASGEDLDASYRASGHGVLLEAERARVYHHTVASGRVPRSTAATLSALNMAFLLRKHAGPRVGALLRLYLYLARRTCAEGLKDLFSGRFAFPQFRGLAHAGSIAWRLWTVRSSALGELYGRWQRQILSHDHASNIKY